MKRFFVFSSIFVFISLLVAATETIAQNRKSVSGAEVTGTFRDASGSEFRILALGKDRLRVAFSGIYNFKMADGGDMANLGEATGEAEIAGDTATFKSAETEKCLITLKFLPGRKLKVTQKGTDSDCGFGVNVSAAGDYRKISNVRPKFVAP